ncbi:zinc finger BED domain-containing protein RICESLEEPER 2-like [Alnus glutinosa]|uniref:zinc finger BED domain-containing protein RICESLEEPER 2-like n=1 Tax=Alnus glutinosa TaxID=3517 RepID=UPI002D766E6A|nr:zinc finger BED domain-containing protein RICESLEEPER 2-like [Alnus glutinosa]
MDELIVNVDEGSLDVNLNLMNIASDDDDGLVSLESRNGDAVQHIPNGLVSLESPDGDAVQHIPNGESACATEEVQEGDDPQKHACERKPRKKTSPIWKDFKELLQSGVKKAQCIHCKSILGIPASSATTQFHRHLNSCIPLIVASKKQKVITFDSDCGSVGSRSCFTYDHKKVRELASHMILYHDYPFMVVEHVLFNKFMRANTPYWQKISRTTAKSDCMSTYEIEKKKLKNLLKNVNKVNITTDMWTLGQRVSYMGIENKVSTITVDNARNNDVAIRILKDDFTLKKTLAVKGQLFHVRCCAHITNLLVEDGISQIGDIVDCVRDGTKYIVASDGRLKQFLKIAKQLQLSYKKLILDVPTRWNNTYMMLSTALEFREVFPRYEDRDQSFHWVPSVDDWVKVENVCHVLEVFNEVTKIV